MTDAALRRDRRRFLKRATFAAAALASAPAAAFAAAQKSKAATKPKTEPAPPPAATPATPAPPPISDDAKALATLIQRRYGANLTPEQLEAVTRQIDQSLQGGRRLRDVKFANGDEPDFTYKP